MSTDPAVPTALTTPEKPFLLRTGKPHISFSELRGWLDCSYRHKLQHIDKIDAFRPSYHMVFGSAVHAAIEHFLKTKEMKVEIAHDYIKKHWLPLSPGFSEPKEKDFSIEKLFGQATEILNEIPKFMDDTFKEWEFVAAEQSLYEAINSEGAKFKGFIDCIIKAKGKRGEDLIWILDWKTSGTGWHIKKKREKLVGLQLTLYKGFWLKKLGDPALTLKNVRCGYVILKRKAKPEKHCELFSVSVGEVTLKRGLQLVDSMLMALKRGVFIKNRNSCTYCDFRDTEHCT